MLGRCALLGWARQQWPAPCQGPLPASAGPREVFVRPPPGLLPHWFCKLRSSLSCACTSRPLLQEARSADDLSSVAPQVQDVGVHGRAAGGAGAGGQVAKRGERAAAEADGGGGGEPRRGRTWASVLHINGIAGERAVRAC